MEYFTKNFRKDWFFEVGWRFELGVYLNFNFIQDREIKNYYRIYFIREGAAIFILNGRRRFLESPAFLLLNDLDEMVLDKKDNLKADLVVFDPRIINHNFINGKLHNDSHFTGSELNDCYYFHPFVHKKNDYFGYIPASLIIVHRTNRLIQEINRELSAQDNDYWPCISRSFLIELLFLIRRLYGEPNMSRNETIISQKPSEAEEIILYLHTHYGNRFTIDELARIFNTNRTTLMNKFRNYTSLSIKEYMLQFRVRLSAMLLRDTTIPVAEIMERAGFIDPAHFGRTFKKHTGFNPRSYRKQYNWIDDPSVLP